MMKKRPDLFCKIIKNSKERVLMQKLDTNQFSKFFSRSSNNLPKIAYINFINSVNDDENFNKLKNFKNSDNFNELEDLQKEFINLKLEIYEFFEKFISQILPDNTYEIRCDLHSGNFGFIKGTQQIRCFDPIYIDLE